MYTWDEISLCFYVYSDLMAPSLTQIQPVSLKKKMLQTIIELPTMGVDFKKGHVPTKEDK